MADAPTFAAFLQQAEAAAQAAGESLQEAPRPLLPVRFPVTYSDRLAGEIEAHVLNGASPRVAAQAVGVNAELWKKWTSAPMVLKEPFRSLAARVEMARGMARARAEAKVCSERPETWLRANGEEQAADWNQAKKVEVRGQVAHVHTAVDLRELSIDQLRAKRRELAEAEATEATYTEASPHDDEPAP